MGDYCNLYNFIDAAKRAAPYQLLVASNNEILIRHSIKKIFFRYSLTETMREENRKTWEAFNQAIKNIFGNERIARFRKYGVDLQACEKSGVPFFARYAEMAAVIGSDVRTSDMKHQFGNEKLKYLTAKEIEDRMRRLNPVPYIGKCCPVEQIYGSPTEWTALFRFDPFLGDKERLHLCTGLSSLSHPDAYLERWAKSLVNREMVEGIIVPAPTSEGLDYYKVYRKIALGGGLVAYALKPLSIYSSLKPMLIFRPSQFALSGEDFPETWMNDAQLKFGKWGYSSAKKELMKLMDDPKFYRPTKKIIAAGFSLGGGHLQRFLVDHALKVSKAVFFNDPSLEKNAAETFANRMNSLPRLNDKIWIKIYRTVGDITHYLGEKHLFWGVKHPDIDIEISEIDPLPEDKITGSYLHSHRFLDAAEQRYKQRVYRCDELDAQLDNVQRGKDVIWYEKARRSFPVRFVYSYMCTVYLIGKTLFRLLGLQLFRNSQNNSF